MMTILSVVDKNLRLFIFGHSCQERYVNQTCYMYEEKQIIRRRVIVDRYKSPW